MTDVLTETPRVLADGFSFTECPRWRDGWLYFSDMHGRTVYRVDEAGTLETVCRVEARPGGLGFTSEGELLVVSMDDARLLRLEAGALVDYADLKRFAPTGLNDMVLSPNGVAYAGKYSHAKPPPTEPLLVITPGGEAREQGGPLKVANGLVVSADGRRLIVAESAGQRLSQFDIALDGPIGGRRDFACLPAGHYPDGICGDAEGGVWVACCRGPGLVRVLEGGEITHSLPMAGERFPFACALGGADGRTLFICSAARFDPDRMEQTRTARIETVRAPFPQSGVP